MLGKGVGHESEVEGEGKQGRTLPLISVDLASYLCKLGKGKGKEGHRRQMNAKEGQEM